MWIFGMEIRPLHATVLAGVQVLVQRILSIVVYCVYTSIIYIRRTERCSRLRSTTAAARQSPQIASIRVAALVRCNASPVGNPPTRQPTEPPPHDRACTPRPFSLQRKPALCHYRGP